MYSTKSNILILNAPTASGKTLSALLRYIAQFDKLPDYKKTSAMFIYPTNELMNDQVSSIKNLLIQYGYKNVLVVNEHSFENIKSINLKNLNEYDIVILALSGEKLEELLGNEKRSKGKIILDLFSKFQTKKMILCTNIDTLYLAFLNKYYRSKRIFEELFTKFRYIHVDEFHMYFGITLMYLMYLMNLYIRTYMQGSDDWSVIFSSATHLDSTKMILQSNENLVEEINVEVIERLENLNNHIMKNNNISYIEFYTTDLTRTKKFYSDVFGWTFEDYSETYATITNAEVHGGFEQRENVARGGVLVVLCHDNLGEVKEKVIAYGGEITVDIFSFPGGERFQFLDDSGNELAVWTQK